MTHGSLYSGIGGWLLAAQRAGIENVFTCEIDNFCNKILDKHFPNTDRHYDIKETDFTKYQGSVDILSTSDPCQPFSFAGKRSGKADDRYLWPQTIRVIREVKPPYVVFENVSGFISLGFETVASDLEAEGYAVESFVIPACAIGAWHRRDRLWIVAYSVNGSDRTRGGQEGKTESLQGEYRKAGRSRMLSGASKDVPDTKCKGLQGEPIGEMEESSKSTEDCKDVPDTDIPGSQRRNSGKLSECTNKQFIGNGDSQNNGDYRQFESRICRMANGLSPWVYEPDIPRVAIGVKDRVNRLKSLGNAIVPQIALILFEAIKEYDRRI